MRTPVVEGDHIFAISHDEHRATWCADHHAMGAAQLSERPNADEASARVVHDSCPCIGLEMNVCRSPPHFKCGTWMEGDYRTDYLPSDEWATRRS